MFVAIARYQNGGHDAASPIMISDSVVSAVNAARQAEELGYTFSADEGGIAVFQLSREHPYERTAMHIEGPPANSNVIVFLRTRQHGQWEERWCNPRAQVWYEREAGTAAV